MNQPTLNDILERAGEQDFYRFKAGTDKTLEYHQEDIEHFLTKEITGLLEGLKGEELKRYKKGDFLEHRDQYNSGHNKREQQLRETIGRILG